MHKDLWKGALGSLAFALAGALCLAFADLSWPEAIIAWATVLFFGGGFVVLVTRLWRQASRQPTFHARIPADIRIEQLDPDDEIEESWSHTSAAQPLLRVTAQKWKEGARFRWQVYAYLPTLVHDPVWSEQLGLRLHEALRKTCNVVEVGRDDVEVWVVDGEPEGRDLVANAGAALASCIPAILPTLQRGRQGP
ncbi:hypothetical protein [Hydrogenophaga flava]|uniref:hypothetical protein n=1 Tax=Hydrogenophaga flava TaxID=65657 RepID=UPI000826E063|nr:hypothetical protein [Hydrogenophaga flava]